MKKEDEKLREAARMLSVNCEGYRDGCEGCLFCRDNLSCKIDGIPMWWDSDFGLDKHIVDANKKVSTPTDTPIETDAPTDTPTDTVAPTDAPTASKTRQERFLEMFPRADAHTGVLEVCPGDIDVRYTCHGPKDCADCKKEYWLAAEKEEKS
jgi:hypothetical protein|nr:MAG TPA: hypothetical protein [Caudoviricetes sp.]